MAQRILRRAWTGIAAVALAASPAAADEQIVDGIAAQVGGDIVLVSEVLRMTEPTEKKMSEAGISATEIAKLRAEGLEQMIEWRLIEQIVRQSDLTASDEEIDGTIQSIAQENNLSVDELRRSVTSHGLSYSDYRAEIKRELERRKVVTGLIGSKVSVVEKDVMELYDQRYANQPTAGEVVHVSQIVIPFGKEAGRDKQTAWSDARAAAARIAAGEPFETVALDVSAVAASKGGDIGWLHFDRLAPWMSQVLDQLEPGQVSGILELESVCTLLRLIERKEYEPVTYEMAKPQLEEEVFERHLSREYAQWMEDLRARTYIERRGYFADAAELGPADFPGTGGDELRLP
jgi:peptidyl-prolyl cis-trans isomerase SurA